MGLKGLIAIVLLICTALPGVAQQYNYRHYTTREGLPSMVVYDVLQDKQGFIWIATKDGLSKFDGYRFKTFTTDDGLPDNEIIGITLGPDGKVWAMPFRSGLAYVENDSVNIPTNIDGKRQPVRRFEIDSRGHLWIARMNGTIDEYYGSILNTYDPRTYGHIESASYFGLADSNGNAWLACDSVVMKVDTAGKTQRWLVKNEDYKFNSGRILAIGPYQDIYVYNTLVLLAFKGDSSKILFNAEIAGYAQGIKIMNITISSNGDILLATSQGAFRVRKSADGSHIIDHFLEGVSIGRAFEDDEGNLWFCTLNDGLYMLSAASRQVNNISAENGLFGTMLGSLFIFNDLLSVSSQYGDVYTIRELDGKLKPQAEAFNLYTENLGNCVHLSGLGTWCSSNMGYNIYPEGAGFTYANWNLRGEPYEATTAVVKVSNEFNILNFSTIKSTAVEPGTNGKLWAATANGLFQIDPYTNPDYYEVRKVYFNRASAVAVNGSGVVWASVLKGICYWHKDSLVPIAGDIQALATSMYYSPSGIMWIGSPKGLYGFAGINDTVPLHFTTKSGLPSNIVNSIIELPVGLIIATDKGICLMEKQANGNYKPIPLQINDGLISKEVRQVLAWEDKLVALTSKGLSIIDTTQIGADKTYPKLYFTLVNIEGQDTAIHSSYTLPFVRNSIRLEYIGLSYKSDGDILYRYQMEGVDTGWTQTEFTNVQYPALAPGKYRFMVDARSLQGAWSGKPIAMYFTILPPFWQTWWFRALLLLLVIAIILGVSYAVIRYYRKQSETAQRMTQLEGQALRAQMNPHFIFNALNAIHDFIANSDERSAHLYLGKFAKLIRKILDQSRKQEISLEEEINTLELYVELETLRFPSKFTCHITCPSILVESDIHIPPMLVQPYVENAIRHGLMNSDKDGKLEVEFAMDGELLKVTIKDDGVGRQRATEISSQRLKQHRSAAMEITKNRVQLQSNSETGNLKRDVVITDLIDDNQNPIGTMVSFWISI